MKTEVTHKEYKALESIHRGMDAPGEGWLHELEMPVEGKALSGLISSLSQKGLINSMMDEEGPEVCYWVSLTKAGWEVFEGVQNPFEIQRLKKAMKANWDARSAIQEADLDHKQLEQLRAILMPNGFRLESALKAERAKRKIWRYGAQESDGESWYAVAYLNREESAKLMAIQDREKRDQAAAKLWSDLGFYSGEYYRAPGQPFQHAFSYWEKYGHVRFSQGGGLDV